jgi:hypothetical protein
MPRFSEKADGEKADSYVKVADKNVMHGQNRKIMLAKTRILQ